MADMMTNEDTPVTTEAQAEAENANADTTIGPEPIVLMASNGFYGSITWTLGDHAAMHLRKFAETDEGLHDDTVKAIKDELENVTAELTAALCNVQRVESSPLDVLSTLVAAFFGADQPEKVPSTEAKA